jgi:hypothetical protein
LIIAMRLERQLEELAKLGIAPAPGVGVDEFLGQLDREALEDPPFDLLLTVLGTPIQQEPYDRPMCSRAWNFDPECIAGPGDYMAIVRELLRVANKPPNFFKDLKDSIDFESGESWLEYRLPNGTQRHWDVELDEEWADIMVVNYVMADIEEGGNHFYAKDNGQALVLYYFDDQTAERLEDLAPGCIGRVLPDEAVLD